MADLRQPVWINAEDVPPLPKGWRALPTVEACIQLKPGKLFDSKTVSESGSIPVLNQSETGFLGYHEEEPGVIASLEAPVVTFANHTCAMRLMKQPFSSIQNIFPKVGKPDVTETIYFYYASLGRVGLSDYKGHHPVFRQAHIPIPPLPIQRRIAGILSAYDELIENSQRRIKILESMARALYREWFVHFRFPGHEHHPRVPSPLGEIPKAWLVTTLGRLVEIKKGKNITKDTIRDGNVPVVAGGIAPAYFHDAPNTQSPVITISASGANAGFVNLYYLDVWASDCSYIDLSATPHVFYYYLWLDYRRASVTHLQRGSAQPHVYPKDLAQLEALGVPEELLGAFMSQVAPTFGLMMRLTAKIENLRRTRDLLLPRLLSGQIDVEAIAS